MISTTGPRFRSRIATAMAAAFVALAVVACGDGSGTPTPEGTTETSTSSPSSTTTEPASTTAAPTLTGTSGSTSTGTASATASMTVTATADSQAQLRRNLLSNLTIGLDPAETRDALDGIEVVTAAFNTSDRELWVAVTSGPGIYDLPEAREHVAGIYERSGDDWVELANTTLASGPTFADISIVAADYEGASWIAIDGITGAHSGTFELLKFDGTDLASVLWWFSSMPGAATVVDLDGTEPPEVVLNATDPYVYCYACGVRAWSEVIYRWMDGELVEVPVAGVADDDQLVTDLTEVAAIYAAADLWQRALDSVTEASNMAPNNPDVFWLYTLISRIAEARLGEAGSEQQPFMTNVLAGEYDAAVALMRPYTPEVALSPTGPLIADTVAQDGWEDATALWVLDYTERAIDAAPDLAAAHAVRAFGLLVENPDNWGGALMEMEEALRLQPQDDFYLQAVEYLLEQNGGAFG
ncbi:MAG: hypothetical protein KC461_00755 [Dehalococcoidia bacterium]|nr:hypothetical protein [Dehalococcoidia bacterium]